MKELYIISGAAGMTGSELARILVKEGHKVIGFDNFFASSMESLKEIAGNCLFDFFEYDLNSQVQMNQIAEEAGRLKEEDTRITYINCAAVVHTEHFYHIDRTFETNVTGMKQFLDQAVRIGADTFINCSTSEVYSMHSWKEGGVSEEDYILLANAEHSQRTSYAAGKLLTEFFMRDAVLNHKIKGCSIRFANVYSKCELYPKHIIPHILTALADKGEVELLENSRKNKRTFLHNTDSCRAVLALARAEEALDGSVYNVATDEEISIIDLVRLCAEKMGVQNPGILFKGYRESDPERRVLNTEKIRRRTGWSPKVSLAEGIEMCVGEMRKSRKALVITVAGMARRFSESAGKDILKCLYYKNNPEQALLARMLRQAAAFDRYIIVGGFLFQELSDFIRENLRELSDKIILVKNEHFEDYGSCYSLYLGIKKAEELSYEQLVFAEGDLFTDQETFCQVCDAGGDVVTSNHEDICADRAVAFYYDTEGQIHYIYDTGHEALSIREPFTAIFHSGQVWKFTKKELLARIVNSLSEEELAGTNLVIIQKYFASLERKEYQQFQFKKWVNCNTLADFERTLGKWE